MAARAVEVTTLPDMIDRQAAARGENEALIFPTVRVTYQQLAYRTMDMARALHGVGVRPGDKVGVLMHNCLDFALVLLGASRLGAVAVPVNARFKAKELAHVVGHSDIKVLVTARGPEAAADFPALLRAAFPALAATPSGPLSVPGAPALRVVVDLGADADDAFVSREQLVAASRDVPADVVAELQARVRLRDIACLMYTSGTTATPKGCLLTHESLVRHAGNVALSRFEMTESDRYWDPLPMFHIGALVPMLSALYVGAAFVHCGHFDPEVALRQLEEERCTIAYPAFETIWLQVLNHELFATTDLSALRLIQNIASPERLGYLQERLPTAVQVSSYGATECSSNLTLPMTHDPLEVRVHTIGHPLPGLEVKIVDPDDPDQERAPGEVGELCFRGYSRFEGYYKDPELTAEVIDDEGWFHSRDLASRDEDGRLRYAGRLKDMLKVGGENVGALEVEDFISRHEAVDIVQVVAAPDARYDEVPTAYVQLKPGAEVTEADLIRFCVGQIATYKVPRYVRFVTEWPMSGTKIQKFVLREAIRDELASQGITEAPSVAAGRER